VSVAIALVLGLVIYVFVAIGLALGRSAPADDVAWLAGPYFANPAAPGNPDALDVCRRYLTRHRRHRLVGGLFGVLFAAVFGIRWFQSVSIGIGQRSPLGDLLFCGVFGVIVGTLSAESYRLTMPSGPRATSLAPRREPVGRERVILARVLGLVALGIGVIAALSGHGSLAIATAMIMVVPFGVAELVRHVIDSRTRSAMSDLARILDERIRAFAASSVSYLHLATATLMLGWTVSKVDGLTGALSVLATVAVYASLVGAVVMLRRAAPRNRDVGLPTDAALGGPRVTVG
jgi:hypothetical protein